LSADIVIPAPLHRGVLLPSSEKALPSGVT
jgi:hypothetical protein